MDPDANLKEQLELAKYIIEDKAYSSCGTTTFDMNDLFKVEDAAKRLAELVVALDEWIQNGGSLPEPWISEQDEG